MPPKKPLILGATVAIVASLLVWVTPGFARSEANVVCGQVITSSVVFSGDLVGCPATGLIVQGSNVTVDLNGHLLRGTGGGPGILVDNAGAGALAVTVKNGAIEGFTEGIKSGAVTANPLIDTSPRFIGLRISHNGTGISSLADFHLTLQDSSIVDNTLNGVSLSFAKVATLQNNLIASNGGDGINASNESDGNTYRNNSVVGNRGIGISVLSSSSSLINNVATYNQGGGIYASEQLSGAAARSYVLSGNEGSNNGALGISSCSLDGHGNPCVAMMQDGGPNVASGNNDSQQCLNISCGSPKTCATSTLRAGTKTLARFAADSNGAGNAEAFQATASVDGTASLLCIFLDQRNTANQLVAGVYTDLGGHPGALLVQGMIPRGALSNGSFNTVWVPSIPLAAGTKYWITALSPLGSGTLRVRDHCCGLGSFAPSAPSETSKDSALIGLPSD